MVVFSEEKDNIKALSYFQKSADAGYAGGILSDCECFRNFALWIYLESIIYHIQEPLSFVVQAKPVLLQEI